MAIRFDKSFNAEIRREIDKVNKKFARARKMGFSAVPENIRIRELKAQFGSKYATRRELRRQIAAYKRANVEDFNKLVELESGDKISAFAYKEAQRQNTRLLRKIRRDIRSEEKRNAGSNLPFKKSKLEVLQDVEGRLSAGIRSARDIEKVKSMYVDEYSSTKKEAFETAIFDTISEQIEFSDLTDEQKAELQRKLRSLDADDLIDLNANDEDFKEILDRYKKKNEYNEVDKKVVSDVYRSLSNRIDSILEEYKQR